MATRIEQLETQLERLTGLLRAHGLIAPTVARRDEDRADYIAFGSEQHMALLGIVEVGPDEKDDYITHEGAGGKVYRLVDEVTGYMHFHDPRQAAKLTLRQKVGELEAGPPPVPSYADAPLWTPEPLRGETWQQVTA
jgi:hypothetical protein